MIVHKFATYWDKFQQLVRLFSANETSEQFWDQKLYKHDSDLYRPYTCLIPVLSDLDNLAVSTEELDKSAFGILRLQEVYKLDTRLLRRGIIRGFEAVRSLSDDESLAIVGAAARFEDKCRGARWIKHLSHMFAQDLKVQLNINIGEEVKLKCRNNTCISGNHCRELLSNDKKAFLKLCDGKRQGWNSQLKKENRLHHCEFYSPHPVFYWQPMKVEWLASDPKVGQFIEFASREELHALWDHAPKAFRSQVVGTNKTTIKSDVRTGTQSWFPDNHWITKRLSLRIQNLINMNYETSDDWQIGSYGIGGHYSVHHDYFEKDYAQSQWFHKRGYHNRLATFMIYLADVELGGYTAFPRMNIFVKPVMGNAIFWTNLHSDGEGQNITLHGGCPVLLGNKKIANKWIYYGGQMLRFPCLDAFRKP